MAAPPPTDAVVVAALVRKSMFRPSPGGTLTFADVEPAAVSVFVPVPSVPSVPPPPPSSAEGAAYLHAVVLPLASSPRRPVVLFSHGNAGNISGRVAALGALARALDVTLVAYDYRGFGLSSPGPPSETSILTDGAAALAFCGATWPGRPLVAWGESMGGAVTAYLATLPFPKPAALVMHITFGRLADVVSALVPAPLAPLVALLPAVLDDPLQSADRIAAAALPTAVLHARDDRLVPLASAQSLFEAAPGGARLWVTLEGGHGAHDLRAALPHAKAFLDAHVLT